MLTRNDVHPYITPDVGQFIGNVPNTVLTQDEVQAIAFDAGMFRMYLDMAHTSAEDRYNAVLCLLSLLTWLRPTREGYYLPRSFVERFLGYAVFDYEPTADARTIPWN